MWPQGAISFQWQMDENFDAKVLIWMKSVKGTLAMLNLLNAVQFEQMPVTETTLI